MMQKHPTETTHCHLSSDLRTHVAYRRRRTAGIVSVARKAVKQVVGPDAGIRLWKPKQVTHCAQRRRRAAAPGAQSGVHVETPSESRPGVVESPDERSRPPCTPAPLDVNVVKTLPTALELYEAKRMLQHAVSQASISYAAYRSGLVRLEVPLPRSTEALRWLRGQPCSPPQLMPRIYFSPRLSAAPDTKGGAAASAAAAGSGAIAGVGSAWTWQGAPGQALSAQDMQGMEAFLSAANPRVRAMGGTRFDGASEPSPEWQAFGSFCFMIPRLELLEAAGCCLLSCTLAWKPTLGPQDRGFTSLEAAMQDAQACLSASAGPAPLSSPALHITRESLQHCPSKQEWQSTMNDVHGRLSASSDTATQHDVSGVPGPLLQNLNLQMARDEYELNGQQGLDQLLSVLGGEEVQGQGIVDPQSGLTKVVLARRSDIAFRGNLDPLLLLAALQEKDPRAYQFCLQLPNGSSFLGSSPEQLYSRTADSVASEAVAATRPRGPLGDVERDFWLAYDLLQNPKDHAEFTIVRNWVQKALQGVCTDVTVEREKSILKQGAIQHLYGRLSGKLREGVNDASLLAALHPTPAVCGRPREGALAALSAAEPFDRGFYSGPFGWISGAAAEFAVAIRSALVHGDSSMQGSASSVPATDAVPPMGLPSVTRTASVPIEQNRLSHDTRAAVGSGVVQTAIGTLPERQYTVSMYAGVGLVCGSDAEKEWQELDLKVRPLNALLRGRPVLSEATNINMLWAHLTVDELCRLGASTFCIAPGSRSSPLTAAAAMHPRARIVPCIDERSLAFWALGYGQANGTPAVVITSSGTAVANLLPAVVEASQSNVPMIILSADRPGELRDTGANQTIDQVKIFGGYTRWAFDLPPSSSSVPARMALTTIDTAHRHSVSPCPGPVHINVQLREPLSPVQHSWSPEVLQGLERWEGSDLPYTSHALPPPPQAFHSSAYSGAPFMGCITAARRGIIVVGQGTCAEQAAAALRIAETLGWPLVADVLSGLRIGATGHAPARVLQHFDHILLDKVEVWPAVQPDVILQLGGRITSKRTSQFLEWAAQPSESRAAADWIFAADVADRHDQMHLVAHHVQMPLSALANLLTEGCSHNAAMLSYGSLLAELDGAAARQIHESLCQLPELCEPHVAHDLAQALPPGNGLFLGNSMPIRDMDMYGRSVTVPVHPPSPTTQVSSGLGAPVAANRGASGIDGVLSSAAGFAFSLGRGVTLVVGDISFLHDINGLCLLRSGEMRPPLTVVLINNSGGGIFSFLPIANDIEEDVFTQLWSTPQNVDLAGMCRAHGIAHQRVTERQGLGSALQAAWALNKHSVVEVVVGRDSNVEHHRNIQAQVKASVLRALRTLAPHAHAETADANAGPPALPLKVKRAVYEPYALPLKSLLTTGGTDRLRRGFLLHLTCSLPDGLEACGTGEVAPLAGLHRESLLEAEEQLALLTAQLKNAAVPASLALLQGRITDWLQSSLGWAVGTMLPSVRCGLEGALLSALADARHLPLHTLLAGCPLPSANSPAGTAVNGLLNCQGNPEERAQEAKHLVSQGYKTLKIKVGRLQPLEDAAAVLHIREAVGRSVELRADANQKWCLSEALHFGHAVKAAGLQYIEEPGESLEDSLTFFQETGVPIALDESLDHAMRQGGPASLPDVRGNNGVAAVVVKPGAVGGFEAAWSIARWARSRGMQVVLSSAFESSIALGHYAHLAAALDTSAGPSVRSSKADAPSTAHGLGTAEWFSADLVEKPLIPEIIPGPNGRHYMGVPLTEPKAICTISLRGSEDGQQNSLSVSSRILRETVRTERGTYSFNAVLTEQQSWSAIESAQAQNGIAGQHSATWRPTVLLLHGFMGCAADWEHVSAALAVTCRCISIDLPGHGASKVVAEGGGAFSIAAMADALEAVLAALHLGGVHVVGYSLGARVALELCSRPGCTAASLTVVSGTAGIVDGQQRKARQEKDAGLAQALLTDGLPAFVETWYQQPMWQSLRAHARFKDIIGARGSAAGAEALAAVLREASPGIADPLWDILPSLPMPTQFVAGALDIKFAALATKMASATKPVSEHLDRTDKLFRNNRNSAKLATAKGSTELDDFSGRAVIIEGAGHAIHTERPQALVPVVRTFAQAAEKAHHSFE